VLLKLTVLTATAVEPDIGRAPVKFRLTCNAGSDTRESMTARFRYFVTALRAVGPSLTGRQARTRSHYLVRYGIIDLVLRSSVGSPPVCHCRYPISLVLDALQVGMTAAI
jgi:hypothetical protein